MQVLGTGSWRLLRVLARPMSGITWRTGIFSSDFAREPWVGAGKTAPLLQCWGMHTAAIHARLATSTTPGLGAATMTGSRATLKPPFLSLSQPWLCVQARTVVKHSKLGKMKTVKAVVMRFRRTGSGKLKYWPHGNVHNLSKKSHKYRRRVKKPRYVSKTQMKTLNKMVSKWP